MTFHYRERPVEWWEERANIRLGKDELALFDDEPGIISLEQYRDRWTSHRFAEADAATAERRSRGAARRCRLRTQGAPRTVGSEVIGRSRCTLRERSAKTPRRSTRPGSARSATTGAVDAAALIEPACAGSPQYKQLKTRGGFNASRRNASKHEEVKPVFIIPIIGLDAEWVTDTPDDGDPPSRNCILSYQLAGRAGGKEWSAMYLTSNGLK